MYACRILIVCLIPFLLADLFFFFFGPGFQSIKLYRISENRIPSPLFTASYKNVGGVTSCQIWHLRHFLHTFAKRWKEPLGWVVWSTKRATWFKCSASQRHKYWTFLIFDEFTDRQDTALLGNNNGVKFGRIPTNKTIKKFNHERYFRKSNKQWILKGNTTRKGLS